MIHPELSFIAPGMLCKYYDKVALIIREANLDDIVSVYGKSAKLAKYWVLLLEEQLYIINQDVLSEMKS